MIRYHKGTQSNGYRDTLEVTDVTGSVCLVDVPSYMNGNTLFRCGSGRNIQINGKLAQNINSIISQEMGVSHITPSSFRALRVRLEKMIKSHKATFYEWKDAVDWACGELDISSQLLQCMYPTTDDYLGIMEFRHLGK